MSDIPYILQYRDAIEKGEIEIDGKTVRLVVGEKIRKAVEILASYFDNPAIVFDPRRCYKKFEFIETLCLQGKAPYYNEPVRLMLWQKAFFEALYSFRDRSTGNLLINEALLEIGRKNGKSTMIAADITADLFIGDGGVDICCCSNDDKQAQLIWKEVAGMRHRLDIRDEITTNNLTDIRNKVNDVHVFRMSSKTENKDGRNIKKAYQDEAHDAKDGEIAEAVLRSMSTHDERLLVTVSTNGFISGGYFDKCLDYANKWLEGEIDNPHYLPFLFEQDDEAEVWSSDRDQWQKANPSLIYGVKKWGFIEDSMSKAQVDKESRIHMLTKDFNLKQSNSKAWLVLEQYDYHQEPFTLEDFRGCVCLGAVDLSDCGDLTVAEVLFMRPNDDTKYIVPQFFIPESKLINNDKDNGAKYAEWSTTINPATGSPFVQVCKGNQILQEDVARWFQTLRERFQIETLAIGFDPWHSDVFAYNCDRKTGYGFDIIKIPQRHQVMSYPMKTLERDLNAKAVNYNNNPVVRYCFGNISAKIVNGYIMPEKIGGEYARKIDGVVTMIILYATLEKKGMTFREYLR